MPPTGHHQGYYRAPTDPYSRLPRSTSRSRLDAPFFCSNPDHTPWLAVIGILSLDEHFALRRQVRSTWLHGDPRFLTKFVLRGIAALEASVNESAAHGDMLYLKAPASMPRKVGPLLKLMRWLECATTAWPQARLIGKADDDTYIYLPGVGDHLQRTLSFASGAPVYWGSMESFHWHLDAHRPIGFAGKLTTRGGKRALEHCKHRAVPSAALDKANAKRSEMSYGTVRSFALRNATSESGGAVGPFYFARGPLVFVSHVLARQVVAKESWASRELPPAVASGVASKQRQELTWPWEDVFLGLALAHLTGGGGDGASASSPIYMNLPDEYFTARWGFCVSASTLVWHMKTKTQNALERISKAHLWKQQHHCAPPNFHATCSKQDWEGCGEGGSTPVRWRPCTTSFLKPGEEHSCSAEVQDLLKLLYGRPTGTRCAY